MTGVSMTNTNHLLLYHFIISLLIQHYPRTAHLRSQIRHTIEPYLVPLGLGALYATALYATALYATALYAIALYAGWG
jgi:hypothetical protein